ncbi:sodium- and chloride-dependent GABA transporter 3-like [Scomber scombrus]|uniref:Sodium- and chloride-dependent GABA transporter 3-like n=1 Tax=Scomber scombrus TaxID=13677 RepID=A0AAV1PV83_SCOSC
MLIFLSVDTHFVIVECFITSISDFFPKLFRKPGRHEIFVLIICSSFFLIHLTLVTEGGIYIFQLFDYYACTRAFNYFMALSECLALAWGFGADRIINIIEDMTGQRPSVFFKVCWRYIIPLLSLNSFILYLVDYTHLKINDRYVYPDWAYALGWTMTLSSVLMVPLWAAVQMCFTAGTFRQRLSVLLHPVEDPVSQRRKMEEDGLHVELRTVQLVNTPRKDSSPVGGNCVHWHKLPWATCDNTWNTAKCLGLQTFNSANVSVKHTNTTSAATEFWEQRVLAMSGGIEELGSVRWELALCLLACWVLCYFSIWKGVKSSGKVAYFTATFPYVMLLVLLIRGLTLPGAWQGIYYYLYPDLKRLAHLEVWIEAGSQIFFSYSLTAGTLNVLGSYNEYNNKCYKDCFWLCLLNSGTSFVSGFVVFSVLGFMAQKQGVSVDTVAESGPGLAFIAYPQATALMPLPHFWTVCFFLMLILLTVDTHFVIVESFITTMSDLFPKWLRAPVRHEIFVLVVCLSSFLVHLTLVTEGGIYIFQLVDFYGSTRVSMNFMAVCECVAVGWIFGADRFYNIIEDMTGQRPCVFFKLCWRYIIPLLSLISFILYLVDYKHLRINDRYVYPDWAYALGWTMTLSSVVMVPLCAAGQMFLTAGTFRQRLSVLCRPTKDLSCQRRRMGEEGTTVELRTSVV